MPKLVRWCPALKKNLTKVKICLDSFRNTQKNWNWLFMSKSIYQLFQALWKVIAFEGLKKVFVGRSAAAAVVAASTVL